jgi:hypothetical protein
MSWTKFDYRFDEFCMLALQILKLDHVLVFAL